MPVEPHALPSPLTPEWSDFATALASRAANVQVELARLLDAQDRVRATASEPAKREILGTTHELALRVVRVSAAAAPAAVRATPGLLPTGETAGWARIVHGVAEDSLGDTAVAVSLLERGVSELGPPETHAGALAARVALAVACSHLGDVGHAASAWHEAAALARAQGNLRQEATITANLGFLYGEHDEPGPYEAYTRHALGMLRRLGDPRLVAHALCNLGGALQRAGRLAEARASYEEGLPLALALEWPAGLALYRAGLGGVLIGEGRVEEGLASYQESLDILTELGDTWQHARHQFLIGRHLVELGRFAAALAPLEACLTAARARNFQSVEASCLHCLAQAREGVGDAPGALAALWAHLKVGATASEARVADRVRVAELRLEADTLRREAERERNRNAELEALRAQLEDIARTDSLTGLPNRRHQEGVLHALEAGAPVAVALLDIDHFKRVNDEHGHATGDGVLRYLARRLQACLRSTDTVARWGGEEFCISMPKTPAAAAERLAERLAAAVRDRPFETPSGVIRLTVSIGIATSEGGELSPEALMQRADEALYVAKRSGRAQVVRAAQSTP